MTIFEALVLLIVAAVGVADGGARLATLVIGAAVLDGGAASLAAIGAEGAQAGDRGADRQRDHDQQPIHDDGLPVRVHSHRRVE